jgi:hypothetical protein
VRQAAQAARKALTEAQGAAGAVFRGQSHTARRAIDQATQFDNLASTGAASVKAKEGITKLTTAANDRQWFTRFMQTFGRKSNPVETDIKVVVDDYVTEVGRRPERNNFPSDESFFEASASWHSGLYRSINNTFESKVSDAVAESLIRGSDEGTLSYLERLGRSAVEEGAEEISEAALTRWGSVWNRFQREHPAEINRIAADVVRAGSEMEAGMKLQFMDLIAQSDKFPIPENIRIQITPEGRLMTNIGENWDTWINYRNNVQIPEYAVNSYNNSVRALFDASYGQSKAMDELYRRLVGNSNALVAESVNFLRKSPLAKTPKRRRVRDFESFRNGGRYSPALRRVIDDIEENILPMYSDVDRFGTPFGMAGQPNFGDLNRWLNKSDFKFEVTYGHGGVAKFDSNFIENLPKNVDPLEFAHQLKIAHEKVLVEKFTLNNVADTFGVRNSDSMAHEALLRAGMVENPVFGNQVAFHPDVSREVDTLWGLMHRTEDWNAFTAGLINTQNRWRRLVTAYFPGWHLRNVIGDQFKNGVQGVSPRSQNQAMSLMRATGRLDPGVIKMLQSPGVPLEEVLEGIPSANRNFVRMQNGDFLSVEEIYSQYNRLGLSPTQVSATMGVLERTPTAGIVRKFTLNLAEKVADTTSTYGRMSLFIDRLKKGTGSKEQVFQEAAERVRKVHYDYNHMTQFEKSVMSTVIPFYRYLKNNYPHMASILFTRPGRATVPDKILRNMSQAGGYDVEDGMPWGGFPVPEWVMDRRMWPIAEHPGGVLFADPDYEFNSTLRDFNKSPRATIENLIGGHVSPFILAGVQGLTGKTPDFGSRGGWRDAESRNPLEYMLNTIPQTRTARQLAEGQGSDPGRVGQIAGLGTATIGPGTALREFFQIPEVAEAQEERRQGAAERKEDFERVQREIKQNRTNLDLILELIANEIR